MRICAFSDMHGQLDFKVDPCDIALICGDIVPLYCQRNRNDSETWFTEVFVPWVDKLPCDKVVFIAGNHDFFLVNPNEQLFANNDKLVYLNCNTFEYDNKVIFGTPWCKPFGNWAFMETYDKQDERYSAITSNIDIIMSHDAPYGVSDILLQKNCPWANGDHIGNHSLRTLLDTKNPKLHVFGHLHSCDHNVVKHNDSSVACVSLLNENYNMVYSPLYIDI